MSDNSDTAPDFWSVSSDKGVCLTLGFTYEPESGKHAVHRLCDQSLVIGAENKIRKLRPDEYPTCPDCRTVFFRMRDDGQR